MKQNNENVTEVKEQATWDGLAMDIAKRLKAAEKAKNIAIVVLGVIATVVIIAGTVERQHLVNANLQNDREWRELFSSYDYVSQDGEGINNINTGEQGDLNNGSTSEDSEE